MNFLPALSLLIALQAPVSPAVKTALETKVTARAQGHELRDVLTQLFRQSKLSYVIEPTLRQPLYLQLEDKPLSEALELVCVLGKVEWVERNGVIYVRNSIAKAPTPKPANPEPAKESKPVTPAVTPAVTPKPKPAATVETKPVDAQAAMSRRVTTRLSKVDLRTVFEELSKQASVPIDIADDVPSLKLDAYLIKTSLRYALDRITKATGLRYSIKPSGIVIERSAS